MKGVERGVPAQDCMYLLMLATDTYAAYVKLGTEWAYMGSYSINGENLQGFRLPHEDWKQPKHLRD
jgi:hypothetical protein